MFLEDGQSPYWVNSIVIGRDGAVYTLGRVKRGDKVMGDLSLTPMRRGGMGLCHPRHRPRSRPM